MECLLKRLGFYRNRLPFPLMEYIVVAPQDLSPAYKA